MIFTILRTTLLIYLIKKRNLQLSTFGLPGVHPASKKSLTYWTFKVGKKKNSMCFLVTPGKTWILVGPNINSVCFLVTPWKNTHAFLLRPMKIYIFSRGDQKSHWFFISFWKGKNTQKSTSWHPPSLKTSQNGVPKGTKSDLRWDVGEK